MEKSVLTSGRGPWQFLMIRDIEIEIAVIVVVSHRHARAVVRSVGHTQFRRDIDEDTAAIVAPKMIPTDAVGHVKVEIAVAIVIEPGGARADLDPGKIARVVSDVAQGG